MRLSPYRDTTTVLHSSRLERANIAEYLDVEELCAMPGHAVLSRTGIHPHGIHQMGWTWNRGRHVAKERLTPAAHSRTISVACNTICNGASPICAMTGISTQLTLECKQVYRLIQTILLVPFRDFIYYVCTFYAELLERTLCAGWLQAFGDLIVG